MTWLKPYIARYRAQLARSCALGLAAACASVLLMFTSGFLISRTAEPDTLLFAIMVPIAFVQIFGLGKPIARYFQRLASHDWVFRLTSQLRARLYRALEADSTALGSGHGTGEVLGTLSEDIGHLQNLFLRIVLPSLIAVAACLLIVFALFFVDAAFALAALATFALAAGAVPFAAYAASRGKATAVQAATRSEYETLTDNVLGSADWILSGRGADCVHSCAEERRALQRDRASLMRRERVIDALQALVLAMAACAVIIWAGTTFSGAPNWIAAFAIGFFPIAEIVFPLPRSAAGVHAHTEALQRLEGIEKAACEARSADDAAPPARAGGVVRPSSPARGSIDIRDVGFTYPGSAREAVRRITLHVRPGESIALLGRSGSGKSTLAALIHGDLAPQDGTIRVGGAVGILHQQAYLFNRTIRDNLTLGVLPGGDDELMDALDAVGLASMVRALPRGLDTLVAEGGANFSGGQRQRIALARLLIARTPIVLLDEPFAALDPETEASLQNTLFGAFSDRTLVVITHHLQGIERFDRVAFIEDGRVEMEGAPADLASANARFRKLLAFDRGI